MECARSQSSGHGDVRVACEKRGKCTAQKDERPNLDSRS